MAYLRFLRDMRGPSTYRPARHRRFSPGLPTPPSGRSASIPDGGPARRSIVAGSRSAERELVHPRGVLDVHDQRRAFEPLRPALRARSRAPGIASSRPRAERPRGRRLAPVVEHGGQRLADWSRQPDRRPPWRPRGAAARLRRLKAARRLDHCARTSPPRSRSAAVERHRQRNGLGVVRNTCGLATRTRGSCSLRAGSSLVKTARAETIGKLAPTRSEHLAFEKAQRQRRAALSPWIRSFANPAPDRGRRHVQRKIVAVRSGHGRPRRRSRHEIRSSSSEE